MLITGGITDDQVPYWQPAKWTAKLRATKTDERELLLRMHMGAGHGGASGRYDLLREVAHDYAFVLRAVGLANAEPRSGSAAEAASETVPTEGVTG
jgi:oligopeptidase B